MTIVNQSADFRQGWKTFCACGYLDICQNEAQRAGYAAAWRDSEAPL